MLENLVDFLFQAGGTYNQSPTPLDGMDVWNTISHGEPSPRKEILLNIDLKNTPKQDDLGTTIYEGIALRMGDMKLLINVPNVTWYKPPELGGKPVQEQDVTKTKVRKGTFFFIGGGGVGSGYFLKIVVALPLPRMD